MALIPDLSVRILVRLSDGGAHKGDDIARDFNASVRTVSRAMAALKAAGAPIRGEAGVGYMMKRTAR